MGRPVQIAADIFYAGFIVTLCERPGSMSRDHRAGCRTGIGLLFRYRLFMALPGINLSSQERRRPELRSTGRWVGCRSGIGPQGGVVGRGTGRSQVSQGSESRCPWRHDGCAGQVPRPDPGILLWRYFPVRILAGLHWTDGKRSLIAYDFRNCPYAASPGSTVQSGARRNTQYFL
jgi:hypothetical protein